MDQMNKYEEWKAQEERKEKAMNSNEKTIKDLAGETFDAWCNAAVFQANLMAHLVLLPVRLIGKAATAATKVKTKKKAETEEAQAGIREVIAELKKLQAPVDYARVIEIINRSQMSPQAKATVSDMMYEAIYGEEKKNG